MPKARTKKTRLSRLNLDFVSLVPAGDDPLAKVVLAKAHPDSKVGETMPQVTKADLPDEVVEYIEVLEDITKAAVKKGFKIPKEFVVAKDDDEEDEEEDEDVVVEDVEEDDTDNDEDEEDEEVDDLEEADVKKALSKADPTVKALIKSVIAESKATRQAFTKELKKARDEASEARKIAKAEREHRETQEFVEAAKALPMINTNSEELGGLLKRLHDQDPESGKKYLEVLKAANENIAKGNLFTEIGRPGGTTISAEAQAKVQELRKADPKLSEAEAMDQALMANPELYEQMLADEQ